MKHRLKQIRDQLNLTQEEMGAKLKIKRAHISALENGTRNITDRVIDDVCREFSINETWLRTGKGEMSIEQVINLDEHAKKHNLSDLEIEIIKIVMSIPREERDKVIDGITKVITQANTKEELAVADNILTSDKFVEVVQDITEDELKKSLEDSDFDPYTDEDVQALIREKELEKSKAASASQSTELSENAERKIS